MCVCVLLASCLCDMLIDRMSSQKKTDSVIRGQQNAVPPNPDHESTSATGLQTPIMASS